MAETQELDRLLTQVRRVEQSREKGAEAEIRKTYKTLMEDLQHDMADVYGRYAEDDVLNYDILQRNGYYARFLEEVEQKVDGISPAVRQQIRQTVEQTYEATYNGMVEAVRRAAGAELTGLLACTPEIVRRAVENPISGLTLNDRLNKHRREIIYNIKQNISVGLLNGDRYSTMAGRIKKSLNGDYKKAIRIVRTETHRVREAGNHDAVSSANSALQESGAGKVMLKTWKTMKDERVRPAAKKGKKSKKGGSKKAKGLIGRAKLYDHRSMDGVEIPVDEEFELPSGARTMAPGQSGIAGEDINCRCYLSYNLRNVHSDDKISREGGSEYAFGPYSDEEIADMSREAENIVAQYTGNPSKWSGETIVRDGTSSTPAGKEWNCDISTERNTAMHILIHEHIHAHSVSYHRKKDYVEHWIIEEASVEFLAKEISIKHGFAVLESGYDDFVKALKQINRKANIADTDLEFAKQLINIPLPERTQWLESTVANAMKNRTIEDYMEISEILERLH